MQSRVALISDEDNFFSFITSKINLRKNDELFKFKFDEIPDKLFLLSSSLLIINSENAKEQSLQLLNLLKNIPAIIFGFNEDKEFEIAVKKNGALSYITPFTSKEEIDAVMLIALKFVASINKGEQYRDILVRKNLISKNNEVLIDYNDVLENELVKLNKNSSSSVLVAISPNDKTKFLLQANQIETIILNHIRKNDILMKYAVNKYFLLLYDVDIDNAKKIWANIAASIPEKIFAGFAKTFMKSRQQLVNEALSKLHEAINYDKCIKNEDNSLSNNVANVNFKMFKQDFYKKFAMIVDPVFYQVKQKYNDKFWGASIEERCNIEEKLLIIKCRQFNSTFKITAPGCTKVNIDIEHAILNTDKQDIKRISFNPEEFEAGVLEDLLEQFILEFKKEIDNGNT